MARPAQTLSLTLLRRMQTAGGSLSHGNPSERIARQVVTQLVRASGLSHRLRMLGGMTVMIYRDLIASEARTPSGHHGCDRRVCPGQELPRPR